MSVLPQVQKILDDLDKMLHNKSAVTDALGVVETKTGMRRLHIVLGLVALQGLYLIFGHFAGLLCNTIGFIYPAYVSILAIESASKEDDTQWLTYWVVFAVLSVLEFFSQTILSFFPIYWLVKAVGLIWLYLPATRGASLIYNRFIRPFAIKHHQGIDAAANRVVDAAQGAFGDLKKRLD